MLAVGCPAETIALATRTRTATATAMAAPKAERAKVLEAGAAVPNEVRAAVRREVAKATAPLEPLSE